MFFGAPTSYIPIIPFVRRFPPSHPPSPLNIDHLEVIRPNVNNYLYDDESYRYLFPPKSYSHLPPKRMNLNQNKVAIPLNSNTTTILYAIDSHVMKEQCNRSNVDCTLLDN